MVWWHRLWSPLSWHSKPNCRSLLQSTSVTCHMQTWYVFSSVLHCVLCGKIWKFWFWLFFPQSLFWAFLFLSLPLYDPFFCLQERAKFGLLQRDVKLEEFGGDVIAVEVSGLKVSAVLPTHITVADISSSGSYSWCVRVCVCVCVCVFVFVCDTMKGASQMASTISGTSDTCNHNAKKNVCIRTRAQTNVRRFDTFIRRERIRMVKNLNEPSLNIRKKKSKFR